MNTQQKKLFRIVLTDVTTMESEVVAEYDDKELANHVAKQMKDEYWRKNKWVSVDELVLDDNFVA